MLETAIIPKVLVVDDDDSLREIMTLILEGEGFEVKSASDVPSSSGILSGDAMRKFDAERS
jgi:DNA-binding response OmpR family regulator